MNPPPPPPPFNGPPPSSIVNPPPSTPSSALSALTTLLHLTNSALRSLPTPLPTTAASPSLLPCPFNPNHRLPPSSLFSHFLNCPSSISLPALQYPNTLHSAAAAGPVTPLNPSSDLCLSLENFLDGTNFFYSNCPGVVTLTNNETSTSAVSPPMLTLPGFLSIVCGNSSDDTWKELRGFSENSIRLLPSEIWAVGKEMEAWSDFPTAYSYRILRSILRLSDDTLLRFREWIVAESPKYGVVIDFAMRDHMVLLVRLCLKAIVKEAFGLAGSLFRDEEVKMEDQVSGLSKGSFACPVLVKAVMWLASELRILYGEMKGKFFAINMLKQCVLDCSLRASLFILEHKGAESSDLEKVDDEMEESLESSVSIFYSEESERNSIEGETVGGSTIFVSQVAAAVAALHERSMIEERIKALRESRPLSTYQRNVEHAYVSQKADEERKNRSDYRPIIEHDGLLWQRSRNQDTNKVKTREELLAEERDYKRRRMSYRGKKLKRNTIEVMRDIIEEYMEEIKSSGGIGCIGKGIEDAEALPSEKISVLDSSIGIFDSRKNLPQTLEGSGGRSHSYKKELHTRDDSKDFKEDNENHRRDPKRHYRYQDFNDGNEKVKHNRDDYSRSLDGRNSSSHSHVQTHSRGKQDYIEVSGEGSSRRSDRSHSKSHDRSSHKREREEDNWEHRDLRRSKINKDRRSDNKSRNEFVDRYDPFDSRDTYEDDV
ncbi:U11/U12 small nuclear ribonucleoprotein 48 kDa protein [Forsythia ovata]|uniref:U11/U12 small nuclear ribonucleoprotein 48 kDa protein n=1 Tax=Forsythia ovata TaxID=205694 RepID=A0ABD1R2W7_9LAMI